MFEMMHISLLILSGSRVGQAEASGVHQRYLVFERSDLKLRDCLFGSRFDLYVDRMPGGADQDKQGALRLFNDATDLRME